MTFCASRFFKAQIFSGYGLMIGVFAACQPAERPAVELAQTYCGSCHSLPAPSLLPKSAWEKGVLPKMGLRLGFLSDTTDIYRQIAEQQDYLQGIGLGVYPDRPAMSRQEWLSLVRYYVENAPAELPQQLRKAPILPDLPLFRPHPSTGVQPLVTSVAFDSAQQTVRVGTRTGRLYTLTPGGGLLDSSQLSSAVSAIRSRPGKKTDVLLMGRMDPNEDSTGRWFSTAANGAILTPATEGIRNLRRPVHTAYGDLDQDGRLDVVVCQFGNLTGRLTWHEATGAAYREHTLDAAPGARIAHLRDVNKDGWPDVVALLTQGDEQVAVYYNLKNGTFRKETVLRFPSVYGSSYLELADVDRDGDEDILYTNGDNADYSYTLKPYHGVRIFRNDGRFRFSESWFYPLHGATQALARDFDQDGDVDIAAIAFFPDWSRPHPESFVYFENTGRGQFKPRTFAEANRGRWLTMEAADFDRDGDDDLLLGSFFFSVTPTPPALVERWQKAPGLWLLENTKR